MTNTKIAPTDAFENARSDIDKSVLFCAIFKILIYFIIITLLKREKRTVNVDLCHTRTTCRYTKKTVRVKSMIIYYCLRGL